MEKIAPTADLYSPRVLVALKAALGNVNKVALATSLNPRTIAKALSGVSPSEDSMRKIVAAAIRLLPEAELLESGVLQKTEEREEEVISTAAERETSALLFERVGGQYIQRPPLAQQIVITGDASANARNALPLVSPSISTKRCTRCGRVQSVTTFRRRSTARDGLQSWCKNCQDGRVAELWRGRADQDVGNSIAPTAIPPTLVSPTPSTVQSESISESILGLAIRIAELEKQNAALLETSSKLKKIVVELTAALRTATAMAEMLSRFAEGDVDANSH